MLLPFSDDVTVKLHVYISVVPGGTSAGELVMSDDTSIDWTGV